MKKGPMSGPLVCIVLICVVWVTGCASVDVTKTAKGFFPATKADDVEILMTRPERRYLEMATISTTNWSPSETAKMHNAMRAKTAPLGAHAVVVIDSGIIYAGGKYKMWTSGVAIRYNAGPTISQPNRSEPRP